MIAHISKLLQLVFVYVFAEHPQLDEIGSHLRNISFIIFADNDLLSLNYGRLL